MNYWTIHPTALLNIVSHSGTSQKQQLFSLKPPSSYVIIRMTTPLVPSPHLEPMKEWTTGSGRMGREELLYGTIERQSGSVRQRVVVQCTFISSIHPSIGHMDIGDVTDAVRTPDPPETTAASTVTKWTVKRRECRRVWTGRAPGDRFFLWEPLPIQEEKAGG